MDKPVIVLVGRPNVGKSTLFNRLVEQRLAIIDDVPGTTRDRLVAEGYWAGLNFFVVDTGGIDPSKQSNQAPLSIGSADFIDEIRAQVEVAIEEADVVVLVVDAISGVTQADREVATMLRKRQRQVEGKLTPPIVLAVNKADSETARLNALDFYSLAIGEPFAISAIHGTGTGDLLDEIVVHFPAQVEEVIDETAIKVAIVGKPNAGKSSLLNKITGKERAIVSDIPGTTRDALRESIQIEGIPLHVIDTAGLRDTEDAVERIGIDRTWQEIGRADVVLQIVDARAGVTPADRAIAARLPAGIERIVVENKCDLAGAAPECFTADGQVHLRLSAKTGTGIELLHDELLRVAGWVGHGEDVLLARERHLAALRIAAEKSALAARRLDRLELAAEELRLAQEALASITGEFTADDLLGAIFGRFCIGK